MKTVSFKSAISGLPSETNLIESMIWGGNFMALVGCLFGCYMASKCFADEQYLEGKLALTGAFICGIAPKISTAIMHDLI